MTASEAYQTETVLQEFVEQEYSLTRVLSVHQRFRRKLYRKPTPYRYRKGEQFHQAGATHGPLAIVLGITGHRDLLPEDVPSLEQALASEFRQLETAYPSTSFIVLSALADGADRAGARVALEVGFRLIVPLPMPRHAYVRDFDEESRQEFEALLLRAEHVFELPVPEGVTEEALHRHGPARDHQYAQLGAYLAQHCEILIAMWDGVHKELAGGTSQIVKFKLEGVPEPLALSRSELDAPDTGPVRHILTARLSNTRPHRHSHQIRTLYPRGFPTTELADKAYRDIFERMDTFNRDAVRYAAELAEHRRESKAALLPEKHHATLGTVLTETLEFYAIADVLSQRFQKRTFATLRILLTCVFFAAAFYDLYGHFFENEPAILALYPFFFILAFLSYFWAAETGYQTKYLDYRALAEGLRVQFFWRLAGLSDSVADFYMRKQKSELDWIRNAVRSSMTERADEQENVQEHDTRLGERMRIVMRHWVEAQAKYFGRAAHRDHAKLKRHEKQISWLFGSALALAAVQLLIPYNRYVMMTIGLLPIIAALIHTSLQKNALAEHTKQYDRMSVFFHRALTHMDRLIAQGDSERSQALLAELGREALAENGDWILTHRERPLEVPKGS